VHVKDQVIILSTARVPWKHTFDSMTLDFGGDDNTLRLKPRRHGDLQPRQAAVTSSTAGGSAASTSFAYPAAPSSTATNINAIDNFKHSYINTAILPPDPSLGSISVSSPKLYVSFQLEKHVKSTSSSPVQVSRFQHRVQKLHIPR